MSELKIPEDLLDVERAAKWLAEEEDRVAQGEAMGHSPWVSINASHHFQAIIRPTRVLTIIERIARVEQERDRQYEFDAEQIVKIAKLEQERDELKMQLVRLSAPVSDAEIETFHLNSIDYRKIMDRMIAARAKGDHEAK